jgi:hypothetical protein
MNMWLGNNVMQNPYRRGDFRLLRMPVEIIDRSAVLEMASQVRQLVEMDATAHVVDGVPVSISEVNQAEARLLDAQTRLIEELRQHPAAMLDLQPARERLNKAEMAARPMDWSAQIVNPEPLVTGLIAAWFESNAITPGSLGAEELTLPPPWGRPGT